MALPQDDDVVQGQLMKWTNYIHGWQPRWFVFANGVLSYYLSQEEVELGCRGSFKAAAIDINVRQDEPHKFDLIIPNEQELFLEASDAKELQRWIVALQTAKLAQKNIDSSASSNSANSGPQPTSAGLRHIKDIRRQLLHQVTSIQARIQNIQETPINELKKELGSKLKRDTAKANELCVALARAVRELHVAAPASGGGMAPSDIESDTEERFRPETPSRRQFPTGLLPSPAPRHASNTSAPSPPPWELDSPAKLPVMVGNAAAPSNEPARPASPPDQFEDATSEPSTPQAARRTGLAPLALDTPNTPKRNAADRTFFSQMEHKFGDVTIHGDDGIDTREFLEACRCIVPFLNSVGSTTFAPVKSDINGNISKLQGHFDANPVRFNSLQSLVLSEIDAYVWDAAKLRDCATHFPLPWTETLWQQVGLPPTLSYGSSAPLSLSTSCSLRWSWGQKQLWQQQQRRTSRRSNSITTGLCAASSLLLLARFLTVMTFSALSGPPRRKLSLETWPNSHGRSRHTSLSSTHSTKATISRSKCIFETHCW
eukprot:m.79256 g.79256  ORF g.79256 m.79256 type:complete len:543 (+) comp8177_c2_seq2:196-1824(+)